MLLHTVHWLERRIFYIPMVLVNDFDRTLHTQTLSFFVKWQHWFTLNIHGTLILGFDMPGIHNNSFQTTSINFSLTKLHDFDEQHSREFFLLEFQLYRENLFKFTVLLFHRVLVKLLLILDYWALFINWHLVGELFCSRFHIYYLWFVPR